MKTFIIDSQKFSSRETFYDEASRVFGFPEYFGRNLDALYDSLGDIGEPFSIIWKDSHKAEKELGDFFFDSSEIFMETAECFEKT